MDIRILTLNDSRFVNLLEKKLNKKIIQFESGQFADSEVFIKSLNINIKNHNVLIIHQFSFDKLSINDQLIKLLYFSDLLKLQGVKKIDLVLPYYPYSRQAKSFDSKLPGFLFLVDKLLKTSHIDCVYTFELHKSDVIKKFITKTSEISLVSFGAYFFKNNLKELYDGDNICFMSPDEGRADSIKKIADLAGVDFAYIKKKRVGADVSIALDLIGNVKDKNIIIIDDIIDTGNTAINACRFALERGAKSVIGFFGHPVLSPGCVEKLENSDFEKIFITDSIIVGNKIKKSKKIKQTSLTDILVNFLNKEYF